MTQSLVDEGRRLMEGGDRRGAYSHFVTATLLHPDDEQLWIWRAETTDDPHEAVRCLERALEINPENKDAREKLVFVRLNKLQVEARVSGDGAGAGSARSFPVSFRALVVIFAVIFLAASTLLLGGMALLWQLFPTDPSAGRTQVPPTQAAVVLPPTWTPLPTGTPLPPFTPAPNPMWRIVRDTTVRAGPSTAYERLGTLPKDSQVKIVGKSRDSRYLQIENPDGAHLAWIPVESAQIESGEVAALVIPSVVPTLPRVSQSGPVPTARPSPTLLPAFEYVVASSRNVADCGRQTGVNGTIYASRTNAQPLNGVMVRVTAYGQLQGTASTGSRGTTGYWEWYFSNNSEVIGEIALVNSDGSLRSGPVGFHLSSCNGSLGNQFIVDFVGTR